MSDATLKAGAGAPHDNAPGHDGFGAPVCSEAEGFAWPVWAIAALYAGAELARSTDARSSAETRAYWRKVYQDTDRTSRDLYADPSCVSVIR